MATKPKTTTSAGTTMSPMDMVQNPNFNSLMKNQNYFNMISQLLAERQARGPEAGLMPIPSPEEARRMEAAMAERNAALTSGTARPANDPEFIDSREPGKNYTANMVNYVDPTTGQMVARTSYMVPRSGSRFVPVDRFQTPNQPIATTGSAMPQVNPQLEQAMMAAAEQQRNFATQMPINGQNATAYQANADGSMTPVRLPNPIRGDQSIPRPVVAQPNFQIPQMPQMQNYNQMLQQGMRRNQDMNQAAQNLAAPTGPARSFSQVVGGVNRMNRMPRQPRNNSLAPSNQKLI
jgi:hypothetical protein